MINQYKLNISYINEGKLYASNKQKTGHYVIENNNNEADQLSFTINNTVRMENIKFTLEYDYNFTEEDRVYCNGYQSWTDSREFSANEVMKSVSAWSSNLDFITHASRAGDYKTALYNGNTGFFHSYSYGYVRNENKLLLIGSLCENTGFTIIYFDMVGNKIIIEKELEGLILRDNSTYELMNIFSTEGEYNQVFDAYFSSMNIPTPRFKRKIGYTTWYNYFNKITSDIVARDLESISKSPKKIDIFQIDDGYQTAVGDWTSIDAVKFPKGMADAAQMIHDKDMLAGIWLAPFSCQRSSKLAHEHKDWLIKDDKDYPIVAGHNWSGFYTLNFYKPEVREYIKNVFNTVLNDWKFDLVKLDFLYSVCIEPFEGKTRGRIMCDAVEFLRECCGLKLMIGCGVPLFPAFGMFDFCRTGADIDLSWKKPNYFADLCREQVSTQTAITNTIFRRHLDGRAFCNDPDVFILRDTNIKMDSNMRKLVAKINNLFGSLLFVSDDIGAYNDEAKATFLDTMTDTDASIISTNILENNIIEIKYVENDITKELVFDLTNGNIIKGEL